MAPLASLAMEVPFRKAELGVEPVGRGAGMRFREVLQGRGGNLASQLLFLLGLVLSQCRGSKARPRTQQGPVGLSRSQRHSQSVAAPAKGVLRAAAFSRCLGPRGRAG